MSTSRRTALTTALAAVGIGLAILPSEGATAQSRPAAPAVGSRPAVELGYAHVRFGAAGGAVGAHGVAARVMWGLSGPGAAAAAHARRTSLGLHATYTPERQFGLRHRFSSFALGVAADARWFPSPLLGRIDPFTTLGAGALHVALTGEGSPAPSPLLADGRTTFVLSPGIGARLHLARGLAVQGDVRDVLRFGGGSPHNVAYGGSLRLTF